ncbi:MAG: hypothetical protein ACRECQ_08255 [Burkholderiaceae bacterium]
MRSDHDMDAGICLRRERLHLVPLNSARRLQRIGIAASTAAAFGWILAASWMWQSLA